MLKFSNAKETAKILYILSKDFTEISATTGTVQNASKICTLEMSNTNTPDSGILIAPLQKVTLNGKTIYLRCVDGYAETRVLPFVVDFSDGSFSLGTRNGGAIVDDSQIATFAWLNHSRRLSKDYELFISDEIIDIRNKHRINT